MLKSRLFQGFNRGVSGRRVLLLHRDQHLVPIIDLVIPQPNLKGVWHTVVKRIKPFRCQSRSLVGLKACEAVNKSAVEKCVDGSILAGLQSNTEGWRGFASFDRHPVGM